MTKVENLALEFTASIRKFSKAMDQRNSALHAWATEGKTSQLLQLFRIADANYADAYRNALQLRTELHAAMSKFHLSGHSELYRQYLYQRQTP